MIIPEIELFSNGFKAKFVNKDYQKVIGLLTNKTIGGSNGKNQ